MGNGLHQRLSESEGKLRRGGKLRTDGRGQKSDVSGQRSEITGQRSEVRGQPPAQRGLRPGGRSAAFTDYGEPRRSGQRRALDRKFTVKFLVRSDPKPQPIITEAKRDCTIIACDPN